MVYLEKALSDGHAKIIKKGNRETITYLAVNHSENFSDPEEKVRAEFWAELIYRYEYEPILIGVEITLPDITPSNKADLIVFRDAERKRPYAVIECKKEGVTDSEFTQAIEQACGNRTWGKFRANYVMVVAGRTRRSFDFSDKYGTLEREKNIIADLPIRFGKPQEFKYHKNSELDIQAVDKEELISAINKCHQTLWAGGRLSPPTAFSELCKIIFVKISDEKTKRKKGEPYQFQIKTHENASKLGERIRDLYEIEKQKDPEVFTETIKIQDATLLTVVSHLESINLSATDLDVKGLAFEQLMDGFFKGDFGQYFTPRELIDFCVKVTSVNNEETILDPACGSGGFLLHALDVVRHEAKEYHDESSVEHFKHWHDFAQKNLYGIEINEEIARVAKMNMIIHDDGHTNVIGYDALEDFGHFKEINNGFKKNSFDIVLTNPPFGASITYKEKPYIERYDFGKQKTKSGWKTRNNQRIEILFIERICDFLKQDTGKAAVILPDSILTNESLSYVREWILEHFRLRIVVSLPESAFAHFGTSVKTSIVFLERRRENESIDQSERILMCTPSKIGYDSTGRKCESELDDISSSCKQFLESPLTYSPPVKKKHIKIDEFDGIDRFVLEKLGHKSITKIVSTESVITVSKLQDAINPERYKNLPLEDVFQGQKISDLGEVLEDKIVPSKADPNSQFGLIRIDDLPANPMEIEIIRDCLGKEVEGSYFEVREGDILFARLGPTIQNRKIVSVPSSNKRLIASPEFLVLRLKDGIDADAVFAILRTNLYKDLVYSKARGSTPSRYRVSRSDFLKLPFPKIDKISKHLASEMKNRRERVIALIKEAKDLWK